MEWKVPQDTRKFLHKIAEYHRREAKDLHDMAAAAKANEEMQREFRAEAGWHTAAAIIIEEVAKNICPVLLRQLVYKDPK